MALRDSPNPATGESAHAFARALVLATTLDDKLRPPSDGLGVEAEPGVPEWLEGPGRPPGLEMRRGREVSVPPIEGMRDRDQRARILHALANHELQAAELFAWALCAFADAPRGFRAGLLAICADEQRHCRAYFARAAALGRGPTDCPVSGHFWNQRARLATPLGFVCTMGLTFENANLDLAPDYAAAARAAGDAETAALLDEVADDEVAHVRFAGVWLGKLAPGETAWQAYQRVVTFPLGASRARGVHFDAEARRRAGLDAELIAALAAAEPRRPGGASRRRPPRLDAARPARVDDRTPRDDHPRDDHPGDDHPRDDHPRDDHPRDDHPRDDHPRDDRPRDDHPRDDHPRDDHPRADHPRADHPRADHPRADHPRDAPPPTSPRSA